MKNIVYRIIIALCNFRPKIYTCKQFRAVLNYSLDRVVFWDIFFGISPFFNLPADNEAQGAKNKTGTNISLYSVLP